MRGRLSGGFAHFRVGPSALKPRLTRIRYLGEDVKRGAGNRGTVVRVGCAVGALALLLITIASSSSGSPKTGSMFAGSASSSGTALGLTTSAPSTPAVTSSTPSPTPATPAATHHRSPALHSGHTATAGSHALSTAATTTHAPTSTSSASDQASHATTTATPPITAATTTHPATTPVITTPTPPAPPEGCAITGVRCNSPLIYQLATDAGTAIPVIGRASYQSLALQTSFATITQRFGAPLSPAKLKTFLGVTSLNGLIQSQPTSEDCAYYLDGTNPTGRAFQLCFNSSFALAGKAILTSSQ